MRCLTTPPRLPPHVYLPVPLLGSLPVWLLGALTSIAEAPAQTAPVPAASQATAAAPLRLGSWNLERLGWRKPRRDHADYQAIAGFVKAARVDVLAFQESDGGAPLQILLRYLGPTWRFVVGTTGISDSRATNLGFLWDTNRVTLTQCEELTNLPRRVGDLDIFYRAPVCGVFRVLDEALREGFRFGSKLDFRAIAVQFDEGPGRHGERVRRAEVRELRRFIERLEKLPSEDMDIVVLGSFGHDYGDPAQEGLTAGGLLDYQRGAQKVPTSVLGPQTLTHLAMTRSLAGTVLPGSYRVHDQAIAVPPSFAPELREAEITKKRLAWHKTYSAHFPVTVDLDATRDRDPKSRFKAPVHTLGVNTEGLGFLPSERSPFRSGQRVEVRLVASHPGPREVKGRLLSTPGTWVVLRTDKNVDKAFPADKVLEIIRLD